MSRFKCINDKCSLKDKEVIVESVRWVWSDKEKRLVTKTPIFCEECDSELKLIQNDKIPNLCFNKFDSLSPEQKRAVIKKRSQDHFQKTDKGDLANYKKKIIDDNKRMAEGR